MGFIAKEYIYYLYIYKERVCNKERYKKCVCREIECLCVERKRDRESVCREKER